METHVQYKNKKGLQGQPPHLNGGWFREVRERSMRLEEGKQVFPYTIPLFLCHTQTHTHTHAYIGTKEYEKKDIAKRPMAFWLL